MTCLNLDFFDNLLYMGPMFLYNWMCHIDNIKLINYLLLEWIPYHFFPCVSMEIDIDVVLFMF